MNSSSSSSIGGASSAAKMAAEDSQPHLLIVDDDGICRNSLKAIFLVQLCKVSTAENVLQALKLLGLVDDPQRSGDDHIPKVNTVFIDFETVPDVTGYDLVQKIKHESSPAKDARIVFMSSADDLPFVDSNKCLKAGAQRFINKYLIGLFVDSLIRSSKW